MNNCTQVHKLFYLDIHLGPYTWELLGQGVETDIDFEK